uniref:WD_REPEATS_REGION domain-containing protein n=1 Tax=Ascaris lumbricoides TaxID=6252 RepID=A0A0M3HJF2_ASCLU
MRSALAFALANKVASFFGNESLAQHVLWNVYGECENFSVLKGHIGAVMDVHFSTDSGYLFSASTDKTVRVWDMETGACVRKFKSHKDIVNSCHPARRGPQLVCSGSDDGSLIVCFPFSTLYFHAPYEFE